MLEDIKADKQQRDQEVAGRVAAADELLRLAFDYYKAAVDAFISESVWDCEVTFSGPCPAYFRRLIVRFAPKNCRLELKHACMFSLEIRDQPRLFGASKKVHHGEVSYIRLRYESTLDGGGASWDGERLDHLTAALRTAFQTTLDYKPR